MKLRCVALMSQWNVFWPERWSQRTLFLVNRTDMLNINTATYGTNLQIIVPFKNQTPRYTNASYHNTIHVPLVSLWLFTAGYFWLLGIDLSRACLPLLVFWDVFFRDSGGFTIETGILELESWNYSRFLKVSADSCSIFKCKMSQVKHCRTSQYPLNNLVYCLMIWNVDVLQYL